MNIILAILSILNCIIFHIIKKIPNFILDPQFNFFNIYNYSHWVLLSIITFIFHIRNITNYIASSIIFTYLFEFVYNPPDWSHSLHHIVTIFATSVGIYSDMGAKDYTNKIANIQFICMFSSILSNMRPFFKMYFPKKYPLLNNVYKITYLILKLGGMFFHYYILFYNYTFHETFGINSTLILMFLVHLVQVYFCYKIIRSFRKIKN